MDFQEAPQGRHLGLFSVVVMFVGRILGSGFLAISSGMYVDCGGLPFLFFLSWLVASVLALAGLLVYLELGLLFPRSGGTKVFLEALYVRPRMFASVVYLLYLVVFGFTVSNVLVFGEYLLRSLGVAPSATRTRAAGLAFLYAACALHGLSVRHGVRVQNYVGGLKLGLAALVVATGAWVGLFPAAVTGVDNQMSAASFFAVPGAVSTGSFASAVIKGSFAYGGWNSIHAVTNEISDPVRTLRLAGPLALAVVAATYLCINVAYVVVIPPEEIAASGQLIGSLLFERVFGHRIGTQLLTFSLALCTGGNVFVVLYTISRTSQEVFREGFLPFSAALAANWPRDAPLPTLLLSCLLSTLVIVFAPSGDVYNYIVALESYPQQIFIALCAVGVFIARKRGAVAAVQAPVAGTVLLLAISLYLIVVPLLEMGPNPKGLEHWIPFPYLGLLCLALCGLYWFCMFVAGPRFFRYALVAEESEQSDGLVVKRWLKVNRI